MASWDCRCSVSALSAASLALLSDSSSVGMMWTKLAYFHEEFLFLLFNGMKGDEGQKKNSEQ